MTRRRKIDSSKVFEAVESGRLDKNILNSFGLEKKSPAPGKRRKKSSEGGPTIVTGSPLADITISKRGSLVLPKELVKALGITDEDEFIVRRTKAGLILKPVNA